MEHCFHIIEYLAVIAGGVYGILLGRKHGMDFVGLYALAFVMAFGGGTLRDLFLDRHPLFWIRHEEYAIILFVLAVLAWIYRSAGRDPAEGGFSTASISIVFNFAGVMTMIQTKPGPITQYFSGLLTLNASQGTVYMCFQSFLTQWILSLCMAPLCMLLLGAASRCLRSKDDDERRKEDAERRVYEKNQATIAAKKRLNLKRKQKQRLNILKRDQIQESKRITLVRNAAKIEALLLLNPIAD